MGRGRPLRIAYVLSHPIQYQAPLLRAISKREDLDLTVFFSSQDGAREYLDREFSTRLRWNTPVLDGYRHIFLRNWSPRPGLGRFWGLFNPRIVPAVCEGRFDAVVVHGWGYATCWLAFVAATIVRTPLLLRGESNGIENAEGLKLVAKRALLKRLFDSCGAILAIGSLNHVFYQRYGVHEEKLFWSPYTVDNDFFRDEAERLRGTRAVLRKSEGIPDDAIVFLVCGKLTSGKRPLDVIQAMQLLPKTVRSYVLFVGDGPLREVIERATERANIVNVKITWFRNQRELASYYALADVLVFPSAGDQWGLVLNEAMNFGLPVVVSDRVGAAFDLVKAGENGYIYSVGDIREMADCLTRLCVDSDLRARMGACSQELIQSWGIPQTIEGIVEAVTAAASGFSAG